MHQTTVRFSPDLWESLEVECGRLGISAAQYLREAALARLSYTAGRDGDPAFDRALARAGVDLDATSAARDGPGRTRQAAAAAAAAAVEQGSLTAAVAAQGERARQRSLELRAESKRLQELRRGMRTP